MASRLRLALVTAVVVLVFAPAAKAACGGTAERPFLPWLDPLSSTLAPDGTFEAGASGWTLAGGARVVAGNEPYAVHGAGETRSLLLPAGSPATSPRMCMGGIRPVFRFFVRSSGTPLSTLRVQVIYRGLLGVLSVADGGLVGGTPSWQPTLPLGLVGAMLNAPLGTASVQFRISPIGSASSQVDDLYVDPWVIR
jgi:hypothetical protein